MPEPAVSVVVPTRGRAGYLATALASITAQRLDAEFELLVVDDGCGDETARAAAAAGVARERTRTRGLNGARNTGIAATTAPLIAFVDDDVRVPPGWLAAIVEGARRHPEAEAFAGPIRPSLEGPAPRSCGREAPPITTLDLGPEDRETDIAWGANLIVRRSAVERIGAFDPDIPFYGDEADWVQRLRAAGGRVAYLAAAGLDHRRTGADARLRALARAEYRRGRNARRSGVRKGTAPSLARELRDLCGAGWHTAHRRCPLGIAMAAHSLGRLTEALRGQ